MSLPAQPTITIETITPEDARKLLDRNTRNRTLNKLQVQKIAQYMKTGGFRLTGDAIRIGTDGTLFDGQHRLAACIMAGLPFQTAIIRDLPDDVLFVIDSGKSRTTRDKLEIARHIRPWVTDTLMGLLILTEGYGVARTVRTDHLGQIIERNPAITESADAYKGASKFGMAGAIAASELILRANGYQQEAEEWRALWLDGMNHPSTRAALAFRQRLIANVEATPAERWRLSKKMGILPNIILKTAAHAEPPKTWRADPKRFPSVGFAALMTGIDFARKTPIDPAMMTLIMSATTERVTPLLHTAPKDQLPMFPEHEEATHDAMEQLNPLLAKLDAGTITKDEEAQLAALYADPASWTSPTPEAPV